MSESVECRVQRLVRELVTVHLDTLLVLLAERSVAVDEQRQRMDDLVRALVDVEVDDTLDDGRRAVPIRCDQTSRPPSIRLHRQLVDAVDDAEILSAFQKPVAQILGLSRVVVGLVLQCEDGRQLKKLCGQSPGRCGGECARVTEIASLVDYRMNLFEQRLGDFADHFGDDVFLLLAGRDDFCAAMADGCRGWPDWAAVAQSPFMEGAIDEFEVVVDGVAGAPEAAVLVEMCWESLELSAQSFLRHAARRLRAAADGVDVEAALRKLAVIVDDDGAVLSEDLASWPAYAEVSSAWTDLFREEQRLLAWTPGRRPTPTVSVLGKPLETLRLAEPASLPWASPLLSWSIREQNALRDLLVGLRRSLQNQRTVGRVGIGKIATDADTPAMQVDAAPVDLQARVAASTRSKPVDYNELIDRAINANHQAMLVRFDRLEASKRQRALQSLRSAYGGYFGAAEDVWSRRFGAWQQWDEREAFTVLSTEVRHLLGAPVVFDPFEDPRQTDLRAVPTFVVVVARPDGIDRTMLHVPLVALRNTFRDTPVRVRVVETPADDPTCRWDGDVDVDLRTIEESPTDTVLDAIENDAIRLLVYESLSATGQMD